MTKILAACGFESPENCAYLRYPHASLPWLQSALAILWYPGAKQVIDAPGYVAALQLFNNGHHFEAHEVWEDVWRSTAGEEREFLQGLIQAAVAIHHHRHGNSEGAESLAGKALEHLECYPTIFAGVALGDFREQLRRWRLAIKTEPAAPPPCIVIVEAG